MHDAERDSLFGIPAGQYGTHRSRTGCRNVPDILKIKRFRSVAPEGCFIDIIM